MFTFHIRTEIVIQAPVRRVWEALADFPKYKAWNPAIISAQGVPCVGHRISILIRLFGKKPKKYKIKITSVQENRSLAWLGHYKIPGLVDGYHAFELEALDELRTRLVHKEDFRGLLVPFVKKPVLVGRLLPQFHALNSALKIYVEGKNAPQGEPHVFQ